LVCSPTKKKIRSSTRFPCGRTHWIHAASFRDRQPAWTYRTSTGRRGTADVERNLWKADHSPADRAGNPLPVDVSAADSNTAEAASLVVSA
jgi:hypothetical protein